MFVANRDVSQISVYGIEKGLGALTKSVHGLKLPLRPGSLRLDSGGDTLWVLAEDGLRLLRFAVDGASGRLTLLSDEPLEPAIVDLAGVAGSRK